MAETDGVRNRERQLVVFRLADAFYGVDIGSVREIIRTREITYVPGAPHVIEGVINLRGKICPVVDLRKRLDVAVSGTTDDTRIVVVEVDGEDVGVMVDAVTEVLRISDDCVEPRPPTITTAKSNLVESIANVGDRLILLVALESALRREAGDSFAEVEEAAA